ncbi:P-loop containing nucleoside triphosphate hydrolase protein [Marasmius fiardii PR-910]|nr:P-loop containing nucleoside triphosphate hydrolase protein [Marasmius fiardii PR-910]
MTTGHLHRRLFSAAGRNYSILPSFPVFDPSNSITDADRNIRHSLLSERHSRRCRRLKRTPCRPTSSLANIVSPEGTSSSYTSSDLTPPDQIIPSESLISQIYRFDWRIRPKNRFKAVWAASDSATVEPSQKKASFVRRVKPPPSTLEPHEPFYGAVQKYQERFIPLLRDEQNEEEHVLRERLSTWPLAKLKEEGYTLTGLSAYWQKETRFGRPVASFLLGPGLALPEHKLLNGNQILLSRIDPLKEEPTHGSVISSTASQLSISFNDPVDLDAAENGWRIDLGQSQYIFDLMKEAVCAFNQDVTVQEATQPTSEGYDRQFILHGTHLRDVLLRSFVPSDHPHSHRPLQSPDDRDYVDQCVIDHGYKHGLLDSQEDVEGESKANLPESNSSGVFQDNMLIHSWAARYSKPNPVVVEGDPLLDGLNESQKRAMAMMIGERISLVQGPPGTGKTKTIIETVKLLKSHFQVPEPILVCTYTNVAVDNLVEGLASAGLQPLRASSAGKVRLELQEYTLDYKMEKHPLHPELKKLFGRRQSQEKDLDEVRDMLIRLRTKEYMGTASDREVKRAQKIQEDVVRKERVYTATKKRLFGLEQRIRRELLDQADVICTTCLTAASMSLNLADFPVVFLDEASMSTEPASLIPIMKGSRHLALIGDHKQLPPVIVSPEAQASGLGISLFERLTEEGVVPSIMLNIQYRMHPAISHFPSHEFYNYSLRDGTVDHSGYISPRLLPPNVSPALLPPSIVSIPEQKGVIASSRPPVIFLDHTGNESLKAKSRVNWSEAHIVAAVVEDLLLNNDDLSGKDIGIIAPYAAQISLLTRLFNSDPKYEQRFRSVLGDHRAMQLGHIEVKTVDGFEGRQKEVIIFSTVRNNAGGYIGFLADRRRLNVGLTRAKRGLFVVGSASTLKAGRIGGHMNGQAKTGKGADSWKRYIQYLTEQNLILNLDGDSLTKVLYGNVNAVDGGSSIMGMKQMY